MEAIIGRDPACDVWLDAASVSGRHARLTIRGASATIEDLRSTNGTLVNGAPARGAVELRHGDLIQLGEVSASFGVSGRHGLARTERLPQPRRT